LYLGNEDASMDFATLKSRGITHILIAGNFLDAYFPEEFVYLNLPLNDIFAQDITAYFQQAINFINSGKVIFVHCAAGVSRSASMVISYIMATKAMKYQEAHDFVKQKRDVICPNTGFSKQLKKLEELIDKKEFKFDQK